MKALNIILILGLLSLSFQQEEPAPEVPAPEVPAPEVPAPEVPAPEVPAAEGPLNPEINPNMTRCHDSCICESNNEECAECNICTKCRQDVGTVMVGQDFCQCLTPDYRLKAGSTWECEQVAASTDVPVCEWQLFNQIFNMVVHSKCSFEKSDQGNTFIQDIISYDWRRLTVDISDDCKLQLKTRLLWAKDCLTYDTPLDLKYLSGTAETSMTIKIPLIDVFDLAEQTLLTDDSRTIYQHICLAIELGHQRRVIREHRFQLRVYTRRDQVQVFHLTVSKQITEGCDKGQECIIVANLDTYGQICEDNTCAAFKAEGVIPEYIVGDHLYVRIGFKDNTYTKYLTVITVKFIDDAGIYVYVKNLQWFTLKQDLGYVDVDVLLFQPHVNALVEIALKIALEADAASLRQLAAYDEDEVKQTFSNVQVREKGKTSMSQPQSMMGSSKLVAGLLLSLIALLI